MHQLKEIKVWKKALDLAEAIYEATASFPKEEMYGLTSQMRRSAVSVASNISEGAGRNSKGEFIHFLGIAQGSAYELQTQLVLSNRLSLLNEEELNILLKQLDEVQRMNYGFHEFLKSNA